MRNYNAEVRQYLMDKLNSAGGDKEVFDAIDQAVRGETVTRVYQRNREGDMVLAAEKRVSSPSDRLAGLALLDSLTDGRLGILPAQSGFKQLGAEAYQQFHRASDSEIIHIDEDRFKD